MTQNQIAYIGQKEIQRANQARERETNRSNLVNESISKGSLEENTRHNKASEDISRMGVAETSRHNQAGERIDWAKLGEQKAQNIRANQINWANLAETATHNRATEEENRRSNQANETLKAQSIQVDLNRWRTQADALTENIRSNKSNEKLKQYATRVQEQASRLSNYVNAMRALTDRKVSDKQIDKIEADIKKINSDIDINERNSKVLEATKIIGAMDDLTDIAKKIGDFSGLIK